MYENVQSKYCYPGTDTLINLADLRDQKTLDQFDKLVTTKRLAELIENPLKGAFDLNHLSRIHRYIFQDVYPFAGEIRSENINKGFQFANAQFIPAASKELFQQLKQERYLVGMDVEKVADRLAHYKAEINVLHPFREGNGRTQREFIRCLAMNAGYELDWSRADPERILHASILSVTNTRELTSVILQTIVNQEPNRDLMHSIEREGRSRELER